MEPLKSAVAKFHITWFPTSGENQPFWFRARQAKFTAVLTDLCDTCIPVIENLHSTFSPSNLLHACTDWPVDDLVVLSIMLDQMPRNALAIGYGRYAGMDPLDVKAAVDDSFSLAFADSLRAEITIPTTDERVVCFFSLVFRHANSFSATRNILLSLANCTPSESELGSVDPNSLGLPTLALKFWIETAKREKSSGVIS